MQRDRITPCSLMDSGTTFFTPKGGRGPSDQVKTKPDCNLALKMMVPHGTNKFIIVNGQSTNYRL